MNPFGPGAGAMNPLGALNAVQPPPPMQGQDSSILAMLGDPYGSMADPYSQLDPEMFGIQQGMGNPDPFASTPYTGGQSDQLIDQLEGMGLGAQGAAPKMGLPGGGPDLRSILGG